MMAAANQLSAAASLSTVPAELMNNASQSNQSQTLLPNMTDQSQGMQTKIMRKPDRSSRGMATEKNCDDPELKSESED